MPESKIEVEIADRIGIIRLNDPAKLNATSYQMLEELRAATAELGGRISVLILGARGRAFCAGAGLDRLGEDAADVGIGLETHVNPLLMMLRELQVPWIAAVGARWWALAAASRYLPIWWSPARRRFSFKGLLGSGWSPMVVRPTCWVAL
jgi:enoyl-CoA hydratase/carnithine racemase